MAPGTATGERLTMPEMQIITASTPGYINTMMEFISNEHAAYVEDIAKPLAAIGVNVRQSTVSANSSANYEQLEHGESDLDGLLDLLDRRLTYGTLTRQSRSNIGSMLQQLPRDDAIWLVEMAILLIMTSPDFLVQR